MKIEGTNMFYIYVNFFYYSNTCNVPLDGPLREENTTNYGRILTFETIEAAKTHLKDMGVTYSYSPQKMGYEGTYYLQHGEYSSPVYKIRKKRNN
jgi:hypothetical protein